MNIEVGHCFFSHSKEACPMTSHILIEAVHDLSPEDALFNLVKMFIGRPLVLVEAVQDLPPEDAVLANSLCVYLPGEEVHRMTSHTQKGPSRISFQKRLSSSTPFLSGEEVHRMTSRTRRGHPGSRGC